MFVMPGARALRAALLCVSIALLSACGGGGGGGGESSGPPGSFTLSRDSVAFEGKQSQPPPAAQSIRVHLLDNGAAAVGAAFVAPDLPPPWLGVAMTGSAPDFDLELSILDLGLPAGSYSTTLTVGTADSGGNVLRTQTVRINLTVRQGLSVSIPTLDASLVLGHSTQTSVSNLVIGADGSAQWNISADVPWIAVGTPSGTGSGATAVTLDASSLDLGSHQGAITVANPADASDQVVVPVALSVTAPALTVTGSPVVIGGADGLDSGGGTFQVSLGTGDNSYPWTASVTAGAGWLTVNAPSGELSPSPLTVLLDADRTGVGPGRYTGNVDVSVVVRGRLFAQSVPVEFNMEGHGLQVSTQGVAFSSFPARSVLTRTLKVTSTLGRTDVEWSAASDADWLSVTPQGHTGDDLVLTADPTALVENQPHIATVTISSADGSIINTQTVRAGLWVGSENPADVSVTGMFPYVVANPVEPWVYARSGDTTITVYNVYTGAVVTTLSPALASAGDMTMSSDGRLLFVNDDMNLEVVSLDAETGSVIRRYAFAPAPSQGIAYARPDAHPVLVTGSGSFFDVATGEVYAARIDAGWYQGRLRFAVEPQGRYLYTQNLGVSPSTVSRFQMRYSAISPDRLIVTPMESGSAGENGQDLCVSYDGARVYTANGYPYVFPELDSGSLQQAQQLPATPYPDNAECGWNGLFLGGALASGSGPVNVWVYRPNGTPVSSFNLDTTGPVGNLVPDTLVLSGDNTRIIGATGNPSLAFRDAPAP